MKIKCFRLLEETFCELEFSDGGNMEASTLQCKNTNLAIKKLWIKHCLNWKTDKPCGDTWEWLILVLKDRQIAKTCTFEEKMGKFVMFFYSAAVVMFLLSRMPSYTTRGDKLLISRAKLLRCWRLLYNNRKIWRLEILNRGLFIPFYHHGHDRLIKL